MYEPVEGVRTRSAGLERGEEYRLEHAYMRTGFHGARQEERIERGDVLLALRDGQVRIAAAFDAGSRAGAACWPQPRRSPRGETPAGLGIGGALSDEAHHDVASHSAMLAT